MGAAVPRSRERHELPNLRHGRARGGAGDAFTAIANDPSGLLYDPAGLVDDFSHTDVSNLADLYRLRRHQPQHAGPLPDSLTCAIVGQAASEL